MLFSSEMKQRQGKSFTHVPLSRLLVLLLMEGFFGLHKHSFSLIYYCGIQRL